MRASPVLLLVLAGSYAAPILAVEQVPAGTYNTNDPADGSIPGFNTGWAQPATQPAGYTYTTGWNYVGTVAGVTGAASGIYIGNGWVLTAAHVGPGAYKLDNVTYAVLPETVQNVGSADLTLFQVVSPPALPNLTFATADPVPFNGTSGSNVAMLGYGDGGARTLETWGYNTVTDINFSASVQGYTGATYTTNDFLTATTTLSNGKTNSAQLVVGDSGGGDFIYNMATGKWELAGLNEIAGTYDNDPGDPNNPAYLGDMYSGFEQLDTYANSIYAITGVPEPPVWLLVTLGAGAIWLVHRSRFLSSIA
jgi:hypothetical protein